MNTGPHPVDQGLRLFGEGTPRGTCHMDRASTSGDAEDYVNLVLVGSGRLIVDIEVSSCCAYPPMAFNIHGTHDGLAGNAGELEWKYYVPSEAPQPTLQRTLLTKADGTTTCSVPRRTV